MMNESGQMNYVLALRLEHSHEIRAPIIQQGHIHLNKYIFTYYINCDACNCKVYCKKPLLCGYIFTLLPSSILITVSVDNM